MSIMDRIDRLMLIATGTFLGLLLLESAKPVLAGGTSHFLDQVGFPLIVAPFSQVLALCLCLWNRRITLCRVLLALYSVVCLVLSLLVAAVPLAHFQHIVAKFGNLLFLDIVVESLYLFGFFTLLWTSFRVGPKRSAPAENFFRHARA